MPLKYLIYLLSFTFLLSACGLETDEDEEEVTEESEVTTTTVLVHDQHPLLPLTSGTSLQYSDTSAGNVTATVIYDASESQAQNLNIYEMSFVYGSNTIGLVLSSTSSGVTWLGIEGPVEITSDSTSITLNSLYFDEPIVLIGDTGNATTGTSLSSSNEFWEAASLEIDYTTGSSTTVFDADNEGYGILPAHTVNIVSEIEVSLSGSVVTTLNLATTLSFVEGIGVVEHVGNYIGTAVSSKLSSLSNLPLTIWFDYDGINDPILTNGSDAIFQTDSGNILTDTYSLYNKEELDALDWIDVVANTSTDSYEVKLTVTDDLPTELTSVQVIFEDKQFGRRISGNVTIFEE